jgi:hypothetical protein
MSKDRPPAVPIEDYFESRPLLRHIRIMERFLEEVIEANPKFRDHYAELHLAYLDILEEEFRPHALMLALAVAELELAYPEIERAKPPH